jgi:hypothetical protein
MIKDTSMIYNIDRNLKYHAPDKYQVPRYNALREAARVYAEAILRDCPDSRERSLALTNLEQSVMWANAAIARDGY